MSKMTKEETILMIQLLLEDIRGNWGWEGPCRDIEASRLSESLIGEVDGMEELMLSILDYHNIDSGLKDGRYFRDAYPYGYENMDQLHNLTKTFDDKSDEFKEIAIDFLTYPEYTFEDWDETD